ncbi:molybdenum cofactor biosynthesis protein MoaE [Thermoflavimicrobium dichotomicum]|uniref:Molybdopterin synthase catalytic subunit n=1 Tax=Thermoflavimicrobium dichotomicum TaxID=46223 RepID=A0A1I3SZB5_9BACL|nr:molybdenum cofactor biosynthesis protein MoaE [Thermoflavimicrobium dichotomicum]SFJ62647.1 molybdopterin synthase catalytic subunit [Thermoflavimicrobium dichotomicum]
MFVITQDKIDVQAVIEAVQDPHCGGTCTFIGTVRDLTDGKKTAYLEYEAYEEMAEKMLKQIGDEVLKQFGCSHVAISHRIGRLEIGDVAVAIAVSAPHRKEAFEGCRYAIEKLKQVVPIWKKEFGEDGSYWV